MTVRLTNNAVSTLAAALGDATSDTQIQVKATEGALFPDLMGEGEWVPLFLIKLPVVDPSGVVTTPGYHEIVHATSRSGDVIGIRRREEGSTIHTFDIGDHVSLRLTEAVWNEVAQSGTSDFTVQHGVNYGTDFGTPNQLDVQVRNVPAHEVGLEINTILRHDITDTINSGAVTLKLPSLPAKQVKLQDGTDPPIGTMLSGRFYNFRYKNPDTFVLQNPTPVKAAPGVAGELELASDTEAETGTDTTKAMTAHATQLLIDKNKTVDQALNPQWRYLGDGADSAFDSGVTPQVITTAQEWNFTDFTVGAGRTLHVGGTGVVVIRCTGTATLVGTIMGPRGKLPYNLDRAEDAWVGAVPYMGGIGGRNSDNSRQTRPYLDRDPDNIYRMSNATIKSALRQALPFGHFQGGPGAEGYQVTPVLRIQPENPGGGVIILAKEFVFNSGAQINVEGRESATTNLIFPGHSGGGCIVLGYQTLPASLNQLQVALGKAAQYQAHNAAPEPIGTNGDQRQASAGWFYHMNIS